MKKCSVEVFKFFSIVMWIMILVHCGWLCFSHGLVMDEVLLSIAYATISCFLVLSRLNNKAKLCVLFLLFAACYLQFININLAIKYQNSDYSPETDRLLYLSYGFSLVYTLYQQWLAALPTFLSSTCVSRYISIFMLLILLTVQLAQVFIWRYPSSTHILAYYMPSMHYVLLLVSYIYIKKFGVK